MNIDVDKIVVSLDVVAPDAVVVEASAVAPSGIVTEAVAELPTQVIVISHEETPTISPLQIIDYGSSSIECAFDVTTEQAEEVVKGVLCGTTNPPTFENADYRLLHGQGSMDLAFAGLHTNTEYYLRPYALSNLGYKYGDVVAQRTKASPIPEEYQLVEYITNNGQTAQWLKFYNIFDVDANGYFRKYDFYVRNVDGSGYGFFFGTLGNNLGWWEVWNDSSISDGIAVNIPVTDDFIKFTVNLFNGTYYINDIPTGYPIQSNWHRLDTELCMYRRSDDWQMGSINGRVQKFVVYGGMNADRVDFEVYPVYRKSDNKPGMYDIVNNVFYTNNGSGEFSVGPDKEWEE